MNVTFRPFRPHPPLKIIVTQATKTRHSSSLGPQIDTDLVLGSTFCINVKAVIMESSSSETSPLLQPRTAYRNTITRDISQEDTILNLHRPSHFRLYRRRWYMLAVVFVLNFGNAMVGGSLLVTQSFIILLLVHSHVQNSLT